MNASSTKQSPNSLPSIVFFGSGPVAASALEKLTAHMRVEAVITKPKPDHHRGDVPVMRVAQSMGLPVHTPRNKKELSVLFDNISFTSRVGIVIDYGIIISQAVIDYFPKGIVNSHFSLLPEWRGADPISFSVLSGQKKTGVSLMLITAGLDEGDLLAQAEYQMDGTETTPSLTSDLIELSDHMLREIVPLWLNDTIDAAPQIEVSIAEHIEPSFSRKLTKEDGVIQAHEYTASEIERQIRAFAEWPKSTLKTEHLDIVITKAHVYDSDIAVSDATVGKLQEGPNRTLILRCKKGVLVIDRLKPAGKPDMDAKAFLNGYRRYLP